MVHQQQQRGRLLHSPPTSPILSLMNSAGTQGMVTVDYGDSFRGTMGGQPAEAAAWVAYANADPSIYGTPSDVQLGLDAEGNNWQTAATGPSCAAPRPWPSIASGRRRPARTTRPTSFWRWTRPAGSGSSTGKSAMRSTTATATTGRPCSGSSICTPPIKTATPATTRAGKTTRPFRPRPTPPISTPSPP